jgi:Ca2+-binding RTX toxin-like protein
LGHLNDWSPGIALGGGGFDGGGSDEFVSFQTWNGTTGWYTTQWSLYTTVHSKSTGSLVSTSKKTTVPDLSADFHTYGVDWQADKITWYFDGEPIFQAATPPDMHLPMYMQANLAVGGDWPGSPDATTKFPAELCIDYIRAWTSRPQDVQQLFTLADSGAATRTIPGSKKADNLVGTAGNDWIDGAAGADTMRGGSGDDTYIVDNAKDVVVELAGGGIETIRASVWRAILPANVENLVLTGIAGQAGTGNELNNKLVAHDRGCTLDGGLGNDILVSGNGADTLIGGRGGHLCLRQAQHRNRPRGRLRGRLRHDRHARAVRVDRVQGFRPPGDGTCEAAVERERRHGFLGGRGRQPRLRRSR